VILVAALLLTPRVADALGNLLNLTGVQIYRVPQTPTGRPTAPALSFAGQHVASAAEASRIAGFTVRTPAALGDPSAIYVETSPGNRINSSSAIPRAPCSPKRFGLRAIPSSGKTVRSRTASKPRSAWRKPSGSPRACAREPPARLVVRGVMRRLLAAAVLPAIVAAACGSAGQDLSPTGSTSPAATRASDTLVLGGADRTTVIDASGRLVADLGHVIGAPGWTTAFATEI